jgi:hypothetical protein
MSDSVMLSKRQFNRIKPYFPLSHGVSRVDDLRVISGIIYVIKNGLQCRDAPRGYGVGLDRILSCFFGRRAGFGSLRSGTIEVPSYLAARRWRSARSRPSPATRSSPGPRSRGPGRSMRRVYNPKNGLFYVSLPLIDKVDNRLQCGLLGLQESPAHRGARPQD